MLCRLVMIGTFLIIVGDACAQSSVVLAITNPTETTKLANGAVSASASLVLPDSFASGSANLETGILKSSSIGPPAQGTVYAAQFSSQSLAQISDTVTFAPGASGTGYLQWRFDGTLSGFVAPVTSATAAMVLGVGSTGQGSTLQNIYLTDNPGFCSPNQPFCSTGTSINEVGAIPFQIKPGGIQISAGLSTEAFDTASANFSDTGQLYLSLPAGVTYTSNSGVFLSGASPILSAVPEPQTYMMLLIGIAMLTLVVRRKVVS